MNKQPWPCGPQKLLWLHTQEKAAEALIAAAASKGQWVHLTNLHLAPSWLAKLTSLIRGLGEAAPHPEFRLWLSLAQGVHLPRAFVSTCHAVALERPQARLRPGLPDGWGTGVADRA